MWWWAVKAAYRWLNGVTYNQPLPYGNLVPGIPRGKPSRREVFYFLSWCDNAAGIPDHLNRPTTHLLILALRAMASLNLIKLKWAPFLALLSGSTMHRRRSYSKGHHLLPRLNINVRVIVVAHKAVALFVQAPDPLRPAAHSPLTATGGGLAAGLPRSRH